MENLKHHMYSGGESHEWGQCQFFAHWVDRPSTYSFLFLPCVVYKVGAIKQKEIARRPWKLRKYMLAVSCLCDTQVDNLNHDEAEKFIATKTVGTLNASCHQNMVMLIDSVLNLLRKICMSRISRYWQFDGDSSPWFYILHDFDTRQWYALKW